MTRPLNSTTVLRLLAQRPHTRAELVAQSGLKQDEARYAISSLKRNGMAISGTGRPLFYEITQKGLYRLLPQTDPARQAAKERARKKKRLRNMEYRRAKRRGMSSAIAPTHVPAVDDFPVDQRIVPAPRIADYIVSHALRGRPALAQAWGGAHA